MTIGKLSFYTVCNFGESINFGFGTVRSERVRLEKMCHFHGQTHYDLPLDPGRWNMAQQQVGDLLSKETVRCIGGKVKH